MSGRLDERKTGALPQRARRRHRAHRGTLGAPPEAERSPGLRSGRVSVPPPDAESSSVFKEHSAPVKRANFQTSNFALPLTVFFRLAQLITLRSWDNVQ